MEETATTLSFIDTAIVVVYIGGMVALGSYFFKKSGTVEGFTVGSRSIPGWALGVSIMGTFLSSVTFLATPGKSFVANWSSYVFTLTIPIVCVLASTVFIPFYRNRIRTTAYEHLEARFGYWARGYSGISLILLQVGRIGTVLYLVSLALSPLIGVNIVAIIIVLGVLTIIYTVAGGIEAVVWTDVVQSFVLLGGALICVFLLLTRMPGGVGQMFELAREAEKFSFGGWKFDLAIEGFWVVLIYGIVENIKNFGVDQNYVQRFLSAESDREARKALWIGGLLYVPVSAMFFFLGTALFAFYAGGEGYPAGFPLDAEGAVAGDRVFPFFIVTELPVGVKGLLIAAILAAGMSTLDSSINVSATVWVVDFYKRHIRPDCDDQRMLFITRISTVVIGVIGTAASLLMIQAKTALDTYWQISAIFGGGMLGLFLLGLLVPKATSRGALLGVIAGVIAICWGTFAQELPQGYERLQFPFNPFLVGATSTFAILIVGWVDSLITPRPDEAADV